MAEISIAHADEIRPFFHIDVDAFNRERRGYYVKDSQETTDCSGDLTFDASQTVGSVSDQDEIYRYQASSRRALDALQILPDNRVPYNDAKFARLRRELIDEQLGLLHDTLVSEGKTVLSESAATLLQERDLSATDLLAPFSAGLFADTSYDAILLGGEAPERSIVIATHDENLFGDLAHYGETLYRSSLPHTVEILVTTRKQGSEELKSQAHFVDLRRVQKPQPDADQTP